MFLVSMVSRPPAGMASRALTARLTRTCSSWPGSASTGSRSLARRDGQLDVLAQGALQELLDPGDHLVEVQHPRLDHLAAGEGQQLVGQVRGPPGRLLDLADVIEDRLPARLAASAATSSATNAE